MLREILHDARHLGLTASPRFFLSRRALLPLYGERVSRLSVRGLDHELWFRHGTTDKYVIREIFGSDQYRSLLGLRSPRVIVDCGANIGTTSVYFLREFSRATVIAIEPDPGNFEILERNLTPYRDRVRLIPRAVWSSEGALRFERGAFRDRGEWSIQVRECCEGEAGEVATITPEEIVEMVGPVIDLMKIDIEGAEQFLFSSPRREWLDRVRCLAIELHDRGCRSAFFAALSEFDYRLEQSGEVTICWDLRRRASSGDLAQTLIET
jgi:FkbM family methyltransferase